MVADGGETNQHPTPISDSANASDASRRLAPGLRRVAFLIAGLMCVALAYLGALLPGLPTTPWILLASYCFSRSSPRLERWLKQSPFYGRLIRDWEEHRGIRRSVKLFAVLMIVLVVTLSLSFGGLPRGLQWLIGGLALCGISVIVAIVPTARIPAGSPPTPPAAEAANGGPSCKLK